MSSADDTARRAAHLVKATIDRLSGVLRALELTRADDGSADPDLILILADVIADQINTLQDGILPALDPQGELSREPSLREVAA